MHQTLIAEAEAHPPTGHGVTFGQGIKLHAHIPGPLGLQKTGRFVAVKNQVRVGQIMNDPHPVFPGEIRNLLEEIQIRHFRGGIMRITQKKNFGLGPGLPRGGREILEKSRPGPMGTLRTSAPAITGAYLWMG